MWALASWAPARRVRVEARRKSSGVKPPGLFPTRQKPLMCSPTGIGTTSAPSNGKPVSGVSKNRLSSPASSST